MGELHVKERDIVVPGEVLATGMDFLPAGGAYRDKELIIASQVGLIAVSGRLVKVVALNWKYLPKKGDTVIGQVVEITQNNWFVDIGYMNDAAISLKEGTIEYIPRGADLSQYYNYGDYVVASVCNMSRLLDLTMKGPGLRKLTGGMIIKINPAKVPRIIGKEGSMITMIKQATDCKIIAGQNGYVWMSGLDPEKERVAVEAIRLIERKAHIQGLTEEVKSFMEKELGVKNDIQ